MTRIAFAVFAVLLCQGVVFGQTNFIALYGDTLHSDCSIVNSGFGVYWVEVFHYSADGTRGCRFSARYQNCLVEAEFHHDVPSFIATSGSSQTGVVVDYGDCLSGWIHVMSIMYWDVMDFGTGVCCELPVLPDPGAASGEIEFTDCGDNVIYGYGVSGIVNRDASCPCEIPTGIADWTTTWGEIKALYSE